MYLKNLSNEITTKCFDSNWKDKLYRSISSVTSWHWKCDGKQLWCTIRVVSGDCERKKVERVKRVWWPVALQTIVADRRSVAGKVVSRPGRRLAPVWPSHSAPPPDFMLPLQTLHASTSLIGNLAILSPTIWQILASYFGLSSIAVALDCLLKNLWS